MKYNNTKMCLTVTKNSSGKPPTGMTPSICTWYKCMEQYNNEECI